MKLGDKPKVSIGAISTGSIGLDDALGVGGLPADESLKFSAPNHREKQRFLSKLLRRRRKQAAFAHS